VILEDGEHTYFFAGDTSYTEQLMLDQKVDGVAPDDTVAQQTLARILRFVRQQPTVYLPSHDPEAGRRLAARAVAPPTSRAETLAGGQPSSRPAGALPVR
jgi:glyoxylase-like metal-dependent hydrolase (beta-lactamase superfamily II)